MVAALDDLEADQCPGPCGLPLSETIKVTDENRAELQANLDKYWAAHPKARYFAGFTICPACEVLIRSQKKQRAMDAKADPKGERIIPEARLWTLYRNPN